jgi:hypothetical protein
MVARSSSCSAFANDISASPSKAAIAVQQDQQVKNGIKIMVYQADIGKSEKGLHVVILKSAMLASVENDTDTAA